MPQLMDPDAYDALAIDGELEVTRDGSIPALAERVGYRVVQPGGSRPTSACWRRRSSPTTPRWPCASSIWPSCCC